MSSEVITGLNPTRQAFPLEAPRLQLRHGALPAGRDNLFICGMFTSSYTELAQRLLSSLRTIDVTYALFEVPTVHTSISSKGTHDPVYTKANFIWHMLARTQRPLLYLDVDCVVRRYPQLILELSAKGHDFAIFNWLAQERNDAYVPAAVQPRDVTGYSYYQHAYHVDFDAQDQLQASGAAQLWGPTTAAQELLAAWFATIQANPGVPDDVCLDFTFNNPQGQWLGLRPSWLPKSYARYPWWIFDEPIIDHPDIPYQGAVAQIDDPQGRQQYYPERTKPRSTAPFIPRDCLIDVRDGRVWRRDGQHLSATSQRWAGKLWPLSA